MKRLRIGALILSVCMSIYVLPTQVNAEEFMETDGGNIVQELYEEEQEKIEVSSEQMEEQEELNVIYSEIEDAMLIDSESVEYTKEYGGAYIDDTNTLVICVTEEDMVQSIEDNVIDELDEEVKQEAEDVIEDGIDYKVVDNSYNELSGKREELVAAYENLYGVYGEDTMEHELLDSIMGIGIDQERNVVIVDIKDLSDEKINTFIAVFGNYDCVEFEEGAQVEDCKTYYPGKSIFVITKKTQTKISRAKLSIGYRAYMVTPNGKKQYGFATCGHGCIKSIDGRVYASKKNDAKAIGKISVSRYISELDASFVTLLGERKMGTKTYFDYSGNHYGHKIKANAYDGNVAQGTTVLKCGSTTYTTASIVADTNYLSVTTQGKVFTNLVKTRTAFCRKGDSGGIVYTYNTAGIPCGLIKGTSVKGNFSTFTKVSSVAKILNVYPY